MQESHSPVSMGRAVIVRDERWTVVGIDRFADVALVSLRGTEDDNHNELAAVLTPADLIQSLAARTRLRQRSRRAVLATAVASVGEVASWDESWTAGGARIDLRPWQLEPALAAVGGTMRILLADEVGMGKTIQAALVITELRARGLAARTLVLTPASIREQWAGELRDRFGLAPAVFDQPALAVATASLPPGVNPWVTAPLIISSIDLVKRPEVRVALESVSFDLLIVDEAHHLSPGTDRGAVVDELARRTPWVVLATATPPDGDDEASRFLYRLGDVGTEGVRVFRRSRRAGPGALGRRSRLLFVQPTLAERTLLDATREYARALLAGRGDPGKHLVASVISRRAASSAEAVHGSFMRRIALLERRIRPERQTALPWEDDDPDAVSDAVLGYPGLRDVSHEVEWLRRLADLALAARSNPSKLGVIRRLLRRSGEQLLVFSEYRDVAQVVATALASDWPVAALHGALSSSERRQVVHAFNSGRVRVLVATDAAGEGLNLQARCRLVVNIELPWTPRRLEQRIGRVDRLGQRRRVHAIHLAHRGSYEGTVIARLERRRGRMLTSETGVDLADTRRRTPRLHLGAGGHGGRGFSGAVYASRARSGSSRIVLVHLVTVVDGAGRLIQREVVAGRVDCRPLPGRRLTRRFVRQIGAHVMVRQTLERHIIRMASTASERTAPAALAVRRRVDGIVSHLERLRPPGLWQASLFDRRTEQAAHTRKQSIVDLQQHLRQRTERWSALFQVTTLEPQLVAAWLE
jgi:superfamily II DNA or RNA helicase